MPTARIVNCEPLDNYTVRHVRGSTYWELEYQGERQAAAADIEAALWLLAMSDKQYREMAEQFKELQGRHATLKRRLDAVIREGANGN